MDFAKIVNDFDAFTFRSAARFLLGVASDVLDASWGDRLDVDEAEGPR